MSRCVMAVGTAVCLLYGVAAGYTSDVKELGPNAREALFFTPTADGLHCVSVEPVGNGDCQVYLDGKPGPVFKNIERAEAFISPDGKRWACVFTTRAYESFLVLDGKRLPGSDLVMAHAARFSPDSRYFAWVAGGERFRVMLDGRQVGELPGQDEPVAGLVFSPDSRRLVVTTWVAGSYLLNVDGGPVQELPSNRVMFSPDGKRLATVAGVQYEGDRVVVDGVEGPVCDEILLLPPFSASGRLAYAARDDAGCRVFVEHEPGPAYDEISALVFSGDGNRVCYLARAGDTWQVVVDHEARYVFDDGGVPGILTVDRTGENLAFVLDGDGGQIVMHHTAPGPELYESEYVRDVLLSPDGTRVAFLVETRDYEYGGFEMRAVYVDGELEHAFENVLTESIRFSPNSRHISYYADTGSGLAVVLDGEVAGTYDSLARGGPHFHPDGTLEYLAMLRGRLLRVRHTP